MKKQKGISSVISILLVTIILILGGMVIYLINNPTTVYQVSETIGKISTPNASATYEMTAKDKFKEYASNLEKEIKNFKNYGEKIDGNQFNPDFPTNYQFTDNSNGIIGIKIDNSTIAYVVTETDKYEIGKNIINAGALINGQDASIFIYTIDNSGNLNYCMLDQFTKATKASLTFKKADKLKNIINIYSYNNGESHRLLAIDIEGNIYDIHKNI